MEAQVEATVGVRELRQNLSVYLAHVKEGHTYTVTEHGRAVAELRPLAPAGDPVARLLAAGTVRPAAGGPSDLPQPLPLPGKERLSDVLEDLRTDRI